MFKRVLLLVVVVAGCQGPEGFHARLFDAGAPGTAGSSGFAGTGVLPVMVTGDAGAGGALSGAGGVVGTAGNVGSTGSAGDAATGLAGTGGTGGVATGLAGTGGGGAGAAGTTGGAGAMAGTGGSAAGAGGRRDAGAVDAAPEAPPSVVYGASAWKPTASITAVGNADLPPNAFDGKLTTRWTTGRSQMGDESFLVDLGQVVPVSRVVIDDTTHPLDFPVAFTVEVSTDGATFTPVKMGRGAMITDVPFGRVNARYIRIRQTGTTPAGGSWWSIDELRVYS